MLLAATQVIELALIAVLAALGLAAIDVIYVTRGVIAKIYLADAALEAMFIVAWAVYALQTEGAASERSCWDSEYASHLHSFSGKNERKACVDSDERAGGF